MTERQWIERLRDRIRGANGAFADARVLEEVETALRQHPSSAKLWNMRGDLIQMIDGHSLPLEDALASYQRAMELAPHDPEAYESIGYYFDAVAERVADAEPMLRRAVELGGGAASWAGLARVLAELGRTSDALALLAPSSCPYADEPMVGEVLAEIRAGWWSRAGDG